MTKTISRVENAMETDLTFIFLFGTWEFNRKMYLYVHYVITHSLSSATSHLMETSVVENAHNFYVDFRIFE